MECNFVFLRGTVDNTIFPKKFIQLRLRKSGFPLFLKRKLRTLQRNRIRMRKILGLLIPISPYSLSSIIGRGCCRIILNRLFIVGIQRIASICIVNDCIFDMLSLCCISNLIFIQGSIYICVQTVIQVCGNIVRQLIRPHIKGYRVGISTFENAETCQIPFHHTCIWIDCGRRHLIGLGIIPSANGYGVNLGSDGCAVNRGCYCFRSVICQGSLCTICIVNSESSCSAAVEFYSIRDLILIISNGITHAFSFRRPIDGNRSTCCAQ